MWAIVSILYSHKSKATSLALSFLAAKHKVKYVQLHGSHCPRENMLLLGGSKIFLALTSETKTFYKISHRGF